MRDVHKDVFEGMEKCERMCKGEFANTRKSRKRKKGKAILGGGSLRSMRLFGEREIERERETYRQHDIRRKEVDFTHVRGDVAGSIEHRSNL